VERPRLNVIGRRRAQPIGAGHLRPQPAFAEPAQQRLEAGMPRAVMMLHAAHVGRAAKAAVEAVSPAVIRADQFLAASGLLGHHGRMVPADIVEGPQLPVFAANNDVGVTDDFAREVVASAGNLAGSTHGHPALFEDLFLLAQPAGGAPLGSRRIRIGTFGDPRRREPNLRPLADGADVRAGSGRKKGVCSRGWLLPNGSVRLEASV